MMTVVFVILIYSSGMPVLYMVGIFFTVTTFLINKFLLINYYKRSSSMTRTVPLTMI